MTRSQFPYLAPIVLAGPQEEGERKPPAVQYCLSIVQRPVGDFSGANDGAEISPAISRQSVG